MNFTSTYPKGWKISNQDRVSDNTYSQLDTKIDTIDHIKPGQVVIAKTVDPIGLVDIYDKKRRKIKKYRKPNKMVTLGEMKRIWTNFNESLYNSVISIKYLNA